MSIKILFLLLSINVTAWCQVIDQTAVYRQLGGDRYFRVHYENDYFSKKDLYYTQGINLELVHPTLRKNPLTKLLVHRDRKEIRYGISVEHLGYTPSSITHTEILQDDRPFAACLFLKTFSIVNDSTRKMRVITAISTGVIGPAAGGEEMQTTIHRWVHGTPPVGWRNQIQNDVILNYQLDFERSLFSHKDNVLLTGKMSARLGTTVDKVCGGVSVLCGWFDNPFMNFSKQKRKFQIFIYTEPQLQVVGYDATLQGGLLNRSSPYIIVSDKINRIVFQNNSGLVMKIGRFYTEYFRTFITKEFRTGNHHQWGGIRVGCNLHD